MNNVRTVTFQDAAGKWLDYVQYDVKQSSMARYINILQKYLLSEFSDVPVSEITRERAARYRDRLLQNCSEDQPGLSPRTVTIIFSVLRRIVTFIGMQEGIRIEDLSKVTVRQQKQTLRVFTLTEQQTLNRYIRENASLSNTGILLALYAGLRIGEVCALRWQDIDLNDMTLHIRHTMQRVQTFQKRPRTRVVITDPKSICSVREIPLPGFLRNLLVLSRSDPHCFFLTGSPDKFIEPRCMENRFGRVLRECGIHNATFHTLRHTFATRCIEQGFDVKTLSEILGHANVSTTMDRYVHPSMEFKRENMNKLSSLIDEPLVPLKT